MLAYIFASTPLTFLIQSFWRDEAFTFVMTKQPLLNLFVHTAQDFNPPLYYILIKVWMFFFGSSEISLRTPSLLFFFATIYVAFLFLHKILRLGHVKSLLSLLLFLINPLLIYYAFEARMYSMFAFAAILSSYFFIQRKRSRYILATVLGLFTHYFMIFVVLIQLTFAFIERYKNKDYNLFVKPIIVSFLVFFPWLLFVLTQKNLGGSFWIAYPNIQDIFLIPAYIYTGFNKDFSFNSITSLQSLSLLLVVILISSFILGKKNLTSQESRLILYFIFFTFVASILVFLLSFYKPLFLPRYLIFTCVGLLLLTIISLNRMKLIFQILFIILLVVITSNYNQLQLKHRAKDNFSATIREIKTLSKPGDLLYVTNELDFFTAEYYFDMNHVFIYGKTYEEIPTFVGKALISKEKLVTGIPAYPKKAFILKDSENYEIQSRQ